MIVLDTDVLSIVQRGRGSQFTTLANRLDSSSDEVHLTIVTFEEQMRGWLARIARAQKMADQVTAYSKLSALLDDVRHRPVLKYDETAALTFETLRAQKIRIGTMDLRIAAIALANDALLISSNLVDFQKVSGLRVEDWTVN